MSAFIDVICEWIETYDMDSDVTPAEDQLRLIEPWVGTSSLRAAIVMPLLQDARDCLRWATSAGGEVENDAYYLRKELNVLICKVLDNTAASAVTASILERNRQ